MSAPARLADVLRPHAGLLGGRAFIGRHEMEAENWEDGSRWYTDPDDPQRRFRSVTSTIDGTENTPWRLKWAAAIAAETVLDNWGALGALMRSEDGPNAMLKWLKGEADRQRRLSLAIGSWLHDALEALVTPGLPIPDKPAWILGRVLRNGGERILITREALDSWADGLLAFLTRFRAQVVMSEASICNPGLGYATRTDLVVWLPGWGLVCIDLKTGRVSRSVRMQMAAMLRATEVWIPGGGKIEMPECARAGVLHLRPRYAEGFKLIGLTSEEVQQGWDEFEAATRLLQARERSDDYERAVMYPPQFGPFGEVVSIPTVPMIEDSGLRCRRLLAEAGFTWLHELAAFEASDLLSDPKRKTGIRGVGAGAIKDIRAALAKHGLALAGDETMKGAA